MAKLPLAGCGVVFMKSKRFTFPGAILTMEFDPATFNLAVFKQTVLDTYLQGVCIPLLYPTPSPWEKLLQGIFK